MKPPLVISSDEFLSSTEHHFRVMAGPGAGKTHWLAAHIRAVVQSSPRLCFGARVACISYTNVAVNELVGRLGDAADQVEASTIHAFLYRNVVRPYAHLLMDESEAPLLAHQFLDGHEEHRPTYAAVDRWLRSASGKPLSAYDQAEVFSFLRTVRWKLDAATATWTLAAPNQFRRPKYFPTTHLHTYKREYWKDGLIDHDDVLYLAHRLLADHPALRPFLGSRFPYVFIDEFQDTNTTQLAMVRWMADAGSTVGIIGDAEQSIYEFQGALPGEFARFDLPGLHSYRIEHNRRSTEGIVRLLNALRQDGLVQTALRQEPGEAPRLYVGDAGAGLRHANELVSGEEVVVLTRKNSELAAFRPGETPAKSDLWSQLSALDPARARFLEALVRGIACARMNMLAVAVREVLRAFQTRDEQLQDPLRLSRKVSEIERRGMALLILGHLTGHYPLIVNENLLQVYTMVKERLGEAYAGLSLTRVQTGGRFERFASTTSFGSLLQTVRLADSVGTVRTIHQAKGAQFPSVFISLADGKVLENAINPLAPNAEEQRVLYVAASRACDHLFLCVPKLSAEAEMLVRSAGVDVVRL